MAHFSLVLAPDDLNVWMPILACKGLVQAKNQQDYPELFLSFSLPPYSFQLKFHGDLVYCIYGSPFSDCDQQGTANEFFFN